MMAEARVGNKDGLIDSGLSEGLGPERSFAWRTLLLLLLASLACFHLGFRLFIFI